LAQFFLRHVVYMYTEQSAVVAYIQTVAASAAAATVIDYYTTTCSTSTVEGKRVKVLYSR